MILRIALILCSLWPLQSLGQTIVIDIEYQPNTTYQWSRSYINDRTVEYLGAEDMGDLFQQLGIEPYSESHDDDYLEVSMMTKDRNSQKLQYQATLEAYRDDHVSSNPRTFGGTAEPVEIHDLLIHGVINRFQRIEIDSIQGVDSLYEKNKVFKLLDDTHRSWKYPKDTLAIGQKIETITDYAGFQFESAKLVTSYVLEKIEDDVASIRLEYSVVTIPENDAGETLDTRNVQGTGTGLLLYDRRLKQVILMERKMSVMTFSEMMDISVESTSSSSYRWAMSVIN